MKRQANIFMLFLICNILAMGVHWYCFNFIRPVFAWITISIQFLVLVNFPYKKLFKQ